MMSGTNRIRTFEQWVYRAKIDVDRWLKNNGISSTLEWHEWCDKNKLKHPSPATIQAHLGSVHEGLSAISFAAAKATEVVPTRKHTNKRNKPTQEDTEPWHTPAAKRPRHKANKEKKVKTNDS